ncbi:MAG: hypothetical protein IV085_03985 [Thiobacillus sp.]|nr:hypothetical protein [Thiobacillus sp.]
MPNAFCRLKASLTPARTLCAAASLSCIYLLTLPVAHATDSITRPMGSPVAGDSPSASAPTPLSQYQKWQDAPVQDWAASNRRVGEIGGWMTYLRDAQSSGSAPDTGAHSHHGQ